MAEQRIEKLKGYFKKGSYPTEEQFGEVLDSYVHKSEGAVEISRVAGLAEKINRLTEVSGDASAGVEALGERMEAVERLAARTEDVVGELDRSIGEPEGIAPLDGGGKVPERCLPSYVDDVVEVEKIELEPLDDDYRMCIYDTMPEEYADLPDETEAPYGKHWHKKPCVTCRDGRFYLYGTIYSGHSIVEIVYVKEFEGWERYGEKDETGTVTAVSGKIYVYNSTNGFDGNRTYRWSGSHMVLLSSPVVVGEGYSDAFSGERGVALEETVRSLRREAEQMTGRIESVEGMVLGGLISLSEMGYYNVYPDLQAAIDSVKEIYESAYWPLYGSEVAFLCGENEEDAHWEKWRYSPTWAALTEEGDESCWRDDGYFSSDAKHWQRIDTMDGTATGGEGDCAADCAAAARAIVKLQSDVSALDAEKEKQQTATATLQTTVSELETSVGALDTLTRQTKATATSAKTYADNATTKVSALEMDVTALKATVETLQERVATGGEEEGGGGDKQTFANIDEDGHGIMRGAHSSGLTYNYPTTEFNLLAAPTGAADALILLPTDAQLEGTVMRILDPRTGLSATSPGVRIAPYNSTQQILGTEKEDSNYWIRLRSGYVELLAIRSLNNKGESTGRLDWVATKVVKF